MNSQQILQCCMLAMCLEDGIENPQFEEISDEEAQLILKVIASGDFHLDLRQNKSGEHYGKLYPFPVQNSNYIDNDIQSYTDLCDIQSYTDLCDIWATK